MLNSNLPKSQIPIMVVGGGGLVADQLPPFDAEFKSAKIPKSQGGGGGCLVMSSFQTQLETFKT